MLNCYVMKLWIFCIVLLLIWIPIGDSIELRKCAVRNVTNNQISNNHFRAFKLVVSTTTAYFPVFLNWLIYFRLQCPDSLHVLHIICLDQSIEEKLPQYGLKCSLVHYLPNDRWAYNRLWQTRAQVTKQLIDSGYDVLLSDSDALWLRNPFPDLDQLTSSHIIGTRAKFPEAVHGRIGSAICMGFIYIKSFPIVSNFWGDFIATLVRMKNPDDQRIFNELVFRKGLKFTRRLKYVDNTEVDTGSFRHNKQDVSISLLPQHIYRRVCDTVSPAVINNATILHCFTKKKLETMKQFTEKKFGHWRLHESWSKLAETADKPISIDAFLQLITIA